MLSGLLILPEGTTEVERSRLCQMAEALRILSSPVKGRGEALGPWEQPGSSGKQTQAGDPKEEEDTRDEAGILNSGRGDGKEDSRESPSGGTERMNAAGCQMGCQSQGPCWKSNVTTWLEAGDCRFHSGNRAIWGPGLHSFKAASSSSADACVSSPISLDLGCKHWLGRAQCP